MAEDSIPQLVETEWLNAHLDDPDLRVLDCTTHLDIDRETGDIETISGRDGWEDSHIPGSAFADISEDLSETGESANWFQVPSPEQFADAMGELGVGDDTRVVLYDTSKDNMWAARIWWLLRTFGFERAGILDGGWQKWIAEDRPVSSEPPTHDPATFTPDHHPERIAHKDEVRDAIDDPDCCLVNALRTEDHLGDGPTKYGRPGRIPSSVNVPAGWDGGVVDTETATYRSREELRRTFAKVGATDADRVITYCGGGIAASSVAFALDLVGVDDVAVYDGSLSEWGHDPEMPMVCDSAL